MDVEMYEKIDEIMETMHQIGTYLSEYAEAEMKGKKITKKQIENNKILETLFKRVQKAYRELHKLINADKQNITTHNGVENDINEGIATEVLDIQDLAGIMRYTINDLDEYLENSYIELRYISIHNGEGKEIASSIYKKTKFEALRNSEYNLQCANLDTLTIRDRIQNPVGKHSFKEKGEILSYIAECKFYEDYAFKQINKYILDLSKKATDMDEKTYEDIKDKLIEQKYILYFAYLNNKYNGVFQENDIGKFAVIKNYINEGLETMLLGMTNFEIGENIKADMLDYKEEFKMTIKSILEKENISSKISKKKRENFKKSGNKENKNVLKEDDVEIEEKSDNER